MATQRPGCRVPDFLTGAFGGTVQITPVFVVLRLIAAVALGLVVSFIYRRTSRNPDTGSFPTTLTLLCVLIATVTQVIGDNVARAFSLVGALSIVRFRTVVRDTRDTAFVVFAVVVGMAVGAVNLLVAAIGLLVTGAAAFYMARRDAAESHEPQAPLLLSVRISLGHDPERLLGGMLNAYLQDRKLMSVSTANKGVSLQVIYETRLQQDRSAVELVSAMNQTEGVQDVRLTRRGFDAE